MDFKCEEHGYKWSIIDRPVGPQPLPSWLKGVHINWMDGYCNAPTFKLRVERDPSPRCGKIWNVIPPEGKERHCRYVAETEDGVVEEMTARPLYRRKLEMFVDCYGTPSVWPAPGSYRREIEILASDAEDGFAGRWFVIRVEGGEWAVLRGPWYGSHPKGTHPASFVTWDEKERARYIKPHAWWKATACFGLFFKDDLLIRALARFQPHIELARVKTPYGSDLIEPIKPEWDGVPKGVFQRRESEAKRNAA